MAGSCVFFLGTPLRKYFGVSSSGGCSSQPCWLNEVTDDNDNHALPSCHTAWCQTIVYNTDASSGGGSAVHGTAALVAGRTIICAAMHSKYTNHSQALAGKIDDGMHVELRAMRDMSWSS